MRIANSRLLTPLPPRRHAAAILGIVAGVSFTWACSSDDNREASTADHADAGLAPCDTDGGSGIQDASVDRKDGSTKDAAVDAGSDAEAGAADPVVQLSAHSGSHTCALRASGSVFCWGDNSEGQLGDGTKIRQSSPVAVFGLTDAVEISAGGAHTCARKTGGTVVCWGSNYYGALGDGTTTSRLVPVPVLGLTDVVEIEAGSGYSCARHAGGTVSCWGINGDYQLGDDTATNRSTPALVKDVAGAVEIALGGRFACARRAGGTVVCWGNNDEGTLGVDAEGKSNVTGLTDAVGLAASRSHVCARRADKTVVCWGSNQYGKASSTNVGGELREPELAADLSDIAELATGGDRTCAREVSGAVLCMGYNAFGELGNGTTERPSSAVYVSGLMDAVAIAAGYSHTCAQRANGQIVCWGKNQYGQLGAGTENFDPFTTPITVLDFP